MGLKFHLLFMAKTKREQLIGVVALMSTFEEGDEVIKLNINNFFCLVENRRDHGWFQGIVDIPSPDKCDVRGMFCGDGDGSFSSIDDVPHTPIRVSTHAVCYREILL